MARYVLVRNGIAENVCEWDGNTQTWSPPAGVDAVLAPAGVGPGWSYAGGSWSPPTPVVVNQREGDAGWFWLRLFTPTEQGTWNLIIKYAESLPISALAADPWLFAAFNANQQIAKARLVSLDAPSVIAGVSGILRHTFTLDSMALTVLESDARRDEVLSGLIVA